MEPLLHEIHTIPRCAQGALQALEERSALCRGRYALYSCFCGIWGG